MNDRRYFQGSKRGELHELKEELHSSSKEKKKEAVKKVIAAMTVGKDVSSLFPDVLNCMQTGCIELKKLVYLYIINYAKVQPELAILAVNTFFKDSMDSNPLIRALAIRTMGYIRLEQITEYLVEPLRRSCSDPDPYVRKTAAICIAKLYDISPTLMEEQGFFSLLKGMLKDQSAMVVANTVASLLEIYETSINKGHQLESLQLIKEENQDKTINDDQRFYRLAFSEVEKHQILQALNECTEWGQIYILNVVAEWKVASEKDSEQIIDRLTSRLSHANPAVVLSTVRAILNLLKNFKNDELITGTLRKLRPPLVTLLTTSPPEIQYVVLRNVQLIVQSNPGFFESEMKLFYCKYNDPVYIKIEKLNLLYRMVSVDTANNLLKELKEYSTDTNIEFSRNSIKIIALISIKFKETASKCFQILTELITTSHQDHIIQEGIISLRDILRSYPQLSPNVIPLLMEVSECIVEPESRSAFVWIIGEVYEFVQGSKPSTKNETLSDFLQYFVDVFIEESVSVQLQILTTIVKCFLKAPIHNQQLVTDIFRLATTNAENPDVRDRALIYWRLLSTNPEETRKVVLSQKTVISSKNFDIEPKLLEKLIGELGMISSVYQKPSEYFVNINNNNTIQHHSQALSESHNHSVLISSSESNIDALPYNIDSNFSVSCSNTNELINIDDIISYSTPISNINSNNIISNSNDMSSNKFQSSELLDFGLPVSNVSVLKDNKGDTSHTGSINLQSNNNSVTSMDLLSL
ncbi:beta adaptin [Cryptosporidium ubiquitum]|uniref:AP complex subunit beta n=1 Tax=Cryptosporidium ubiquitum TaxID=857276 RepID=A0A1J4MER1_9CRYT|nr:beta adaptin [Cryptosporidium ubiquitum]OII72726.1 beta adaptin [Cryptosporidium ubiquitum]